MKIYFALTHRGRSWVNQWKVFLSSFRSKLQVTKKKNKTTAATGTPDVSALGAAYLAGFQSGVYKCIAYLKTLNRQKVFMAYKK